MSEAAINQRKKVEDTFGGFLEAVPDGMIITNAAGEIILTNNQSEKLFGYTKEELIGRPVELLIPQDFRNKHVSHRIQHAKAPKSRPMGAGLSFSALRKNGTTFPAEISLSPFATEYGELIFASVRDITERKNDEEKLRKSEKNFQLLVNSVKDYAIFMVDTEGRITSWNIGAESIKGYTSSEITGKDVSVFYTNEDKEKGIPQSNLQMALKYGNYETEGWRVRKDGTLFYANVVFTALYDDKANLYGYAKVARDITERKKTEAALSKLNEYLEKRVKERTEEVYRNEQQFRHTLESMLEGIQIIGFDWRYIYVNDAMAKHGQYLKEELIGYTVMEKYPGIEQTEIYKVYQRCFNERVAAHLETEFVFPNKTKRWFELSFQPVPEGLFILSIDITDRKIAEEKIINLNRELEERVIKRTEQLKKTNEELEAFSYTVSHDLRAPLRGIIGFANILEEDYTNHLDEEAKRITGVIKKNTTRMGRLIDDLLVFSRLGRQEILKTDIDSNKMVADIIIDYDLVENSKKIKWIIHPLPSVKADVNTINQVWINLISNAVKYSGNVAQPTIEIGSNRENDRIIFFVKDNGVGFDEKYIPKLFKVFQRLHSSEEFEGTGIGLAIVEKIVSKLGGSVWAEAALNKGASFYFSLPDNDNN